MGIPRDMLGLGLVTEFGEAGHGIVFGNPVGPQVDEYGVPLKRKNKGIPEADSGMSPEDQARFDNALAELEEAAEDAKYVKDVAAAAAAAAASVTTSTRYSRSCHCCYGRHYACPATTPRHYSYYLPN